MKNTIYLDSDFNFLLLENEEADTGLFQTKIYINIPTSDATNQELEISVAGGAPITESIPSEALVNFELSQQYWADNGDVEITPKNDDVTGDTITIHFPETFTVSAALNYLYNDEFEIVAQNENFAEGGSGSGSGSGGGSAFDFVETIRNIGFRLLDEPSNVNAYFDEIAEEVQIKWTDPADISTNEPAPAEWAGTVVVRKEGSAPLHRWDGDLIVDSTTRDQYASSALIDNTLDISKNYYYGIFPYDTKGDYRFTKTILVSSQLIPAPQINSLSAGTTSITVNYSVASGYTYDYITLVYKKNSAPADKTDGTAVSISASNTSVTINGLDENTTYYFKIFAQVTGASEELESNTENATTVSRPTATKLLYDLQLNKIIGTNVVTGHDENNYPKPNEGQDVSVDVDINHQSMPSREDNIYTFAAKTDSDELRVYLFAIPYKYVKKISAEIYANPTSSERRMIFFNGYLYNTLTQQWQVNGSGTKVIGNATGQIPERTWATVEFTPNSSIAFQYVLLGAWWGEYKFRNVTITYYDD